MGDELSQRTSRSRIVLQMLRQFRLLMVIYCPAVAVAIWEFSRGDDAVDLILSPQPNFTAIVCELYPERAEPLYMKAIQAGMCAQPGDSVPDVCRQFDQKKLKQEIKEIFQQGLSTGVRSVEGMNYEYVQFLVVSGGTKAEIDAAYETWRTNFPLSTQPDPRHVRR